MSLRGRSNQVALCAALLALSYVASAVAAPPFTIEKPDFFNDPDVSTTRMGATYAYRSQSSAARQRLMITTMSVKEVQRQFGALTGLQCVNLFVDELRASHTGFFVVAMTRPLIVGDEEFDQFRWTGDKAGKTLTGVLSCGVIKATYFVIDFTDDLLAATHSFPPIRGSLKTLQATSP